MKKKMINNEKRGYEQCSTHTLQFQNITRYNIECHIPPKFYTSRCSQSHLTEGPKTQPPRSYQQHQPESAKTNCPNVRPQPRKKNQDIPPTRPNKNPAVHNQPRKTFTVNDGDPTTPSTSPASTHTPETKTHTKQISYSL